MDTDIAKTAAQMIIDNHLDEASIDTAHYLECGFIIQAAKLALSDDEFSRRISEAMNAHDERCKQPIIESIAAIIRGMQR